MRRAAVVGRWGIAAAVGLGILLVAPIDSWAPQQTPANPEEYVGTEVCSACHVDQMSQFQKTPMAVLLSEKYPVEQRGCEACHGPGQAHVDAIAEATDEASTERANSLIYAFARHSPKENAARCLTCHQKDEKQSLFRRSVHLGAGVSCESCHVAHRVATGLEAAQTTGPLEAYFTAPPRAAEREWLDSRLLAAKQPTVCYSCHKEIEAEFQLPVRHRVNEGSVQCSDCHNPHGSLSANELRATNGETCASCHIEKRGPFVYEHAAVRIEGCTACHTPHGSINLNLLKRRQQRQLCLECHAPPEAVGIPHPRLGFQAAGECTRCHIDIHGSNYQKQFLR